MTAYLAGTDKSYVLTVTTLKVANGRASVAGVTRTPKLTQSQGASLFAAQPHGRCGAPQ
jgi:hypothetical protein